MALKQFTKPLCNHQQKQINIIKLEDKILSCTMALCCMAIVLLSNGLVSKNFASSLDLSHINCKRMLKASCNSSKDLTFQDIIVLHKSYNDRQWELEIIHKVKPQKFLSFAEQSFDSIIEGYEQEIQTLKDKLELLQSLWKPCFEENKLKIFEAFDKFDDRFSKFLYTEIAIVFTAIFSLIFFCTNFISQNRLLLLLLVATPFVLMFCFTDFQTSKKKAVKNYTISSLL